ncbi:thiazole synthase [Vibrio sp. HN007]|uniref:thiazole synthase n=1 Tax=Vibrio iocasae TaxID=3098914 RepID=UPI0035D4B3A1
MLKIANREFESRLFTGTGKFSSNRVMLNSLKASGTELTTLALKRVDTNNPESDIYAPLKASGINLLPNTSGAKNAKEAVFAAQLAREALDTNWVKLEIHPDVKYLMPDPVETLKAAEILVKEGFIVLPYCHADPVLCKRLEEVGCAATMPLASPIGTNKGLASVEFLKIIIEQANVPVIIDAGLGAPSHASYAMELGADAVLINTGIASSSDPIAMAKAFKLAVESGRIAYEAGLGETSVHAQHTSPLTEFLG